MIPNPMGCGATSEYESMIFVVFLVAAGVDVVIPARFSAKLPTSTVTTWVGARREVEQSSLEHLRRSQPLTMYTEYATANAPTEVHPVRIESSM